MAQKWLAQRKSKLLGTIKKRAHCALFFVFSQDPKRFCSNRSNFPPTETRRIVRFLIYIDDTMKLANSPLKLSFIIIPSDFGSSSKSAGCFTTSFNLSNFIAPKKIIFIDVQRIASKYSASLFNHD